MFNHQARWDRALPSDTADAPGTPVPATCFFENGKVVPRSFTWRGREFPVTKVHFSWKDKKGKDVYYFFSVATPGGTFEIAFSQTGLSWRLIRLIGP